MASTVVLARKYRPRNFQQMVGQDTAVRALSNALSQQRLHHAYLFTGTRGIGKTTVSRIFAKCLNCTGADGQGAITATPCGGCDACRQIDDDRFIDYIELDAASNRGISEIRDLLERAAYKPSVGRFKVFMIDEAHQLTKESFNALLKTLEEPPDYIKFILATTDPQKMPATVLSRCLQFNLRPMAPETVHEHLAMVLRAEGIGFDTGSLDVLSRAAQGSMRDALSLTDQAIAFGGGSLSVDAVRQMLGAVGNGPVLALVDALSRRDARAVVAGVSTMRDEGASPEGALEAMAVLLQQLAIEQAVPGSLQDGDDAPMLRTLAQAMPADDVQLLYSIVLHGRRELELAPDPYAGMTMVLLRMLAFPGSDSSAQRNVARGGEGSTSPPSPMAAAESSTSSHSRAAKPSLPAARGVSQQAASARMQPLSATATHVAVLSTQVVDDDTDVATKDDSADPRLADRWDALVNQLQSRQLIAAMVRELAFQSALVGVDESVAPQRWTLVVERDALRAQASQDKLTAALSQVLGVGIVLDLKAGRADDTPAQRETAERQRRLRAAERAVLDDPVVKAMFSQFDTARIVPGSIQFTQEFKP